MVVVGANCRTAGVRGGYLSAMGVLCGNAVHISYCVTGVGLLITTEPTVSALLTTMGAAYLVYLGIRIFKTAGDTRDQDESRRTSRPAWIQGFVSNVLNPKGTAFYLAVFGSSVQISDVGTTRVTALAATSLAVSAMFWIGYITVLARSIQPTVSSKLSAAVDRAIGVTFVALALWLVGSMLAGDGSALG